MHICYNVGKSEVPIDVYFDSHKSDKLLKFQRTILHQETSMLLKMWNLIKISLDIILLLLGLC